MLDYQPNKVILTGENAVQFCISQVKDSQYVVNRGLNSRLESICADIEDFNPINGKFGCYTVEGLLDKFDQLTDEYTQRLRDIRTMICGLGVISRKEDQQ